MVKPCAVPRENKVKTTAPGRSRLGRKSSPVTEPNPDIGIAVASIIKGFASGQLQVRTCGYVWLTHEGYPL